MAPHSLVYVLLMWTALNTIVQVIFISLFFTVGHREQSLYNISSSSFKAERNKQDNNTKQDSSIVQKITGEMVTFKATNASNVITWSAKTSDPKVVSDGGEALTILEDGYYFLNLQVTLNGPSPLTTVRLMQDTTPILEGRCHTQPSATNTCSTGVLSKVRTISAGTRLSVWIEPPNSSVNTSDTVTHLDIIFMHKL